MSSFFISIPHRDRVRCRRGPLYEDDSRKFCASSIDGRAWSLSAQEQALAEVLKDDAVFDLVLLDNIDERTMDRPSTRLVYQLSSQLLVCSRTRTATRSMSGNLAAKKQSIREAMLPTLAPESANELCRVFALPTHCHRLACQLVASGKRTVDDLILGCALELPIALESVRELTLPHAIRCGRRRHGP